jgi:hypothetical protein
VHCEQEFARKIKRGKTFIGSIVEEDPSTQECDSGSGNCKEAQF